ncbi:RIP metalloprotease RseP [Ottowia sp.]|uniref:RIP metalloprotease RseP n=1 Tax=Ottowia sp. TaxID=1898956 RepID=UPI002CB01816|nr:RIP metalloprotease RseP [Ottowia sp.]HRN76611.1 RIP metalloprotease RseP [Ottowia sp.]HRQ02663.1 RIP metalloprotease RseP [Ottowia sp.]
MLMTLIAFVVALGLLIAVHEWGHYRMAVARGVRVERFSVGFGRPLMRFKPRCQHPGQDTEFVLAAIPFGGYVKMLDEREAPVSEAERHLAFNTQPLISRTLIVAAGPVANLLLAVLLYAMVNWIGVEEPRAILSPPAAGSLAAQAGLHGGELVRSAALAGDDLEPVASFESLRWTLTRGALNGVDVVLDVARTDGSRARALTLPLSTLAQREPDAKLFRAIGIVAPLSQPVLGELMAGGAAERAGLREGDLVRRIGSTQVLDGQQLRELIRASGRNGPPVASEWLIEREGRSLTIEVRPDAHQENGQPIGRLGAYVGGAPERVLVRQGPLDGLWSGVERVWQVSALSIRLLGRMVIGDMSLKNLSGPIAIADYAGKSAALGLTYYLGFLAFISVSLGVLNLLPLPVLDGGHLMYYLWEAVTGRPVTDVWLDRLQRVGMFLLLSVMAIAVYNDIATRLG